MTQIFSSLEKKEDDKAIDSRKNICVPKTHKEECKKGKQDDEQLDRVLSRCHKQRKKSKRLAFVDEVNLLEQVIAGLQTKVEVMNLSQISKQREFE